VAAVIATVMADLGRYLLEAGRTPFAYGRHDCCLFLADWVRRRRGVDPAAWFRGAYDSEAACARILAANGGLPRLLGLLARTSGLRETGAPVAGDVGLIEALTPAGIEAAGAICAGRRWVALSQRGVIGLIAQPIVAWSV
jgi:hypothetical protein